MVFAEHAITITKAFQPFLDMQSTSLECLDSDYWKILCKSGSSQVIRNARLLYAGKEFDVFIDEADKTLVCYKDMKHKTADNSQNYYAVAKFDSDQKQTSITYTNRGRAFFSESGNTFFHSSWEKILIHENRLLMHASCIQSVYGGILFTGPSGIGKSTQSDLWVKYENAEVINGDRPILNKDSSCGWTAYGSPYAGSSKCHKNESCKISAIVMLNQSNSCHVKKLGTADAFRAIFPMMTVYQWDSSFVQKVCDLTMILAFDIPVYQLSCTPDRDAVDCLKSILERNEPDGNKQTC